MEYAKEHSVNSTADKFGVHRKSVQEWKRQANSLRQVTKKHASTFRLEGGGRKVKLDAVENGVMRMQRQKVVVSRKRLKLKALKIYQRLVNENLAEPSGFTPSEEWASKFLLRNHLTTRRATTMYIEPPEAYAEKIINFLCYVRHIRRSVNIPDNAIIACDETAIWYDAMTNSTVTDKAPKEASVRSTGHAKQTRLTVFLSAKGDGTKLKPIFYFHERDHYHN